MEVDVMAMFRITHPWSGFEGIFEAETSDEALDAALNTLARSMGYRNYARARLAGRLDAFEMNVERVNADGSTKQVWPNY